MSDSRWDRVDEIFHRALSLPDDQRPTYLDDACGGDLALRAEVDSLIDAHRESDDFLEDPVASVRELSDVPRAVDVTGRRFGPYRVLRELGHGAALQSVCFPE